MNRHQRRRKAAMNKFVNDYVHQLPEVPLDDPMEPGKVSHLIFYHDDWCRIYRGQNCNCEPEIRRFAEPDRN